MVDNFQEKANFIWSVADLLRGPYRPNQYKDVMLPLTVLRRLDCVLKDTKTEVLQKAQQLEESQIEQYEPILNRITGVPFHNTSRFTFEKLLEEPDKIVSNLINFINGFSKSARDIINAFGFEEHIEKLDKSDRLYLLIQKFCEIDLHPDSVSNIEMGYIFEDLIRRFNEASNEEAGDHFTPREVIRLMVNLVFLPDQDILTKKGLVKTLYDPAAGTGGMLSVSEEYLRELNPDARLEVFGQDYNPQAYAICGSDMMIKGQDIDHIQFGDSFTNDRFPSHEFDYMLANPPFGVEWKPQKDFIENEHKNQGYGGRFGAGLPSIDDGALLFLQHMISKMKDPADGGTRLAIVFNGSPLFTGATGSRESNIRKWIIENDWLEAIVALPDQLFYNTGITTYVWVLTNRKEPERKGKVQLVDAREFFVKMRKSLGEKRHEIGNGELGKPDQIAEITRLYGDFKENEHVAIFDNQDFGYHRITVERPLRLNFAVTEERLERVKEATAFKNLAKSKKRKNPEERQHEIEEGEKKQRQILDALSKLENEGIVKNRQTFDEMLKQTFDESGLKVPAQLRKSIRKALSERDETADVCRDAKGNPEPDSGLRDYENVSLKEDIQAYFEREVLPHVPDAWIDHDKTKTGYEIAFNKYFFQYAPPRSVDEIESELSIIEKEISQEIEEVVK